MGKKIISFCLWGNIPKYTIGAIRNAEIAKDIFPDWICRYYISDDVNLQYIEQLKKFNNTEIIVMENETWNGMFWRFYPASDPDVNIMISRDVDSRLTMREKFAVDEWLNSDKNFHIIRDHPHHEAKIMGGLWGVRNNILIDMKNLINSWEKTCMKNTDQQFLQTIIYPKIINDCFIHDEFFNFENEITHKINFERNNYEFLGEYIFDNESFSQYHRDELKNELNKK